MQKTDQTSYERIVCALPFIAGACLVVSAGICSRTVAAWFDTEPPLAPPLSAAIGRSQSAFLIIAAVLFIAGLAVRRSAVLQQIAGRRMTQRVVLSAFLTLTPLVIIEIGFRPIAVSRSWNLYQTDAQRGWKLRPNTTDYVMQLPVHINSRGLRSPEIERVKPTDTHRVLFLGDSVVFGKGIVDLEETIPQRVAARLDATSSARIEAINAGVCGYSPWQQLIYLREDGVRLSPDLVVTNFVLNDVTEKFNLPRFGGSQPNGQLLAAAMSTMPSWVAESGIFFLAKRVAARARFGWTPRQAATRQEMLGVSTLCNKPNDDNVRYAWRVTLDNLRQIARTTDRAGAMNLLVVYPFRFQLQEAQIGIPQQVLAEFAQDEGILLVDLLPVFRDAMRLEGLTEDDLFLDSSHPTSEGARIAADTIAEFIDDHGMLTNSATIASGPPGPSP